jgi:hypothetical protein
LVHAYGAASDVADQLIAAAIGDDATRKAAWWNLWGNIHHHGTIYEATAAAVPIIAALASWPSYPDRVEAISFLREIAAAEGVVVWAYGDGGEIVFDEPRQQALTAEAETSVRELATTLLVTWMSGPPKIRRALLWLLSALPELHDMFSDLVEAELPAEYTTAWAILKRGPESQEEFDVVCEFEAWTYAAPRA